MGFASLSLRPAVAVSTLLLSVSPAAILKAQDAPGTQVTFSVEQRLDYASNPDLDVANRDGEFFATTGFDLNVARESGVHRFTFGAAFDLVAGRDDSDRNGFVNPDLRVDYAQQTAAGRFELDAFLNETDVDALDFLTTGGVVSSVDGSGVRRRTGGGITYGFGENAPFGGALSFDVLDTEYSDTTDPSLTDTNRTTLGLDLRFDLSPITRATLGLRVAELEEEGVPDEDINTLSVGLTREVANGTASILAQATDLDAGTRTSFTLGRFMELPRGDLQVNLGVSNPVSGSGTLVGGIEWRHDLPSGRFQVALDQDVTGDEQEDETRITKLSLRLQKQINARWDTNLFLTYRDSHDQQGGDDTESTSIGINFDYALTQGWDMRFGAEHRRRDQELTGVSDNSKVFVALRRNFEWGTR